MIHRSGDSTCADHALRWKRTLRSYGRWPDLFANPLSTAVRLPA
jgi:hypothetical protein